jgi:hypothetical protein
LQVYSDTTVIASDLVVIDDAVSDVESSIVIIRSDLLQVYSDTTIVTSDTAIIEAAISDVESSLVIVKSDLVLTTSDVAAIESELILVHSETTVVQSDVALLFSAHAEPTGVPAANEAPVDKLGYVFMALRNRVDVTNTKKTFYDDGGTGEWEKDLSDDGTTYSESEGNAI